MNFNPVEGGFETNKKVPTKHYTQAPRAPHNRNFVSHTVSRRMIIHTNINLARQLRWQRDDVLSVNRACHFDLADLQGFRYLLHFSKSDFTFSAKKYFPINRTSRLFIEHKTLNLDFQKSSLLVNISSCTRKYASFVVTRASKNFKINDETQFRVEICNDGKL